MDALRNNQKNTLEKQFHSGLAEPSNPSGFLQHLLSETKDNTYQEVPKDETAAGETADSLRAKLPERRERIRSAFSNISEIGSDVIATYKKICAEKELNPGIVRLYIVGGRIYQKPLSHGSDIDVVITVDQPAQGLQPIYDMKNPEPDDLRYRKIEARRIFMKELETVLDKHDLLERTSDGSVEGWLLEPKGYGFSDAIVRAEWADSAEKGPAKQIAVLVAQG